MDTSGPKPQQDPDALLTEGAQPLTGRISALAVSGDKLLLGAAGGNRCRNLAAGEPGRSAFGKVGR